MRYIVEEIRRHPSVCPQDIIKLLYQASFGAEHILSNLCFAREYLEKEYISVGESDASLYENISDDICRINLSAWKKRGLPIEWLFKMFANSANVKNCEVEFVSKLDEVAKNFELLDAPFSLSEWETYKKEYLTNGISAVHHSKKYRENEKPAYRIISRKYERILHILEKIKDGGIIAIDGRAASGKTTLADMLSEIINSEVIHIDDFFLPFDMRSDKRLQEIGGNIHYERFSEEVISALENKKNFSYRKFDCSVGAYNGEVNIKNDGYVIVEGSYSHHPKFGNYADLKIFSDIDKKTQHERILIRDGEKLAQMFFLRWIPLEEKYFVGFDIKNKADIVVSGE